MASLVAIDVSKRELVMLEEAEDRHFAWMLGEPARDRRLRLPAGGVDERSVLEIVRRMAADVRSRYGAGCWMIVVDGEVVGLCSCKGPPDADGVVEIGYGVAASRRNRGHASRAMADLLNVAAQDWTIRCVVAETAVTNVASQRVLAHNGFVRESQRMDPEDGEVIVWRRDLSGFRE